MPDNFLNKPPGESFIDSPWLQLGIPLLSTVAAGIWPRHAGNASRAAVQGLDVINQNRQGQMRMQHYFQQQKDEQDRIAEADSLIESSNGDKAPQENAPAGDQTPQAVANETTESMDAGVTPSFTKSASEWTPEEKKLYHFAVRNDPKAATQMILEKRKAKERKPAALHWGESIGPGGEQIQNKYSTDPETNETTWSQFNEGVPPAKTDTSRTPYEDFSGEDPAKRAAAEAWQKLGGSQGQTNFQPFVDPNTQQLYGFNPRTNAATPTTVPVGPDGKTPELVRSGARVPMSQEKARNIADKVRVGLVPPNYIKSLGRGDSGQVIAEIAQQGIDLTNLDTWYMRITKNIAAQEAPIQLRLRQAVNKSAQELEFLDATMQRWFEVGGDMRFPILNKANLEVAIQSGGEAGAIAQKLIGQLDIFAGEYSTVLQGGGVPTDDAREMAHSVFKKQMNRQAWAEAKDAAKQNIGMTDKALTQIGPRLPAGTPFQKIVDEQKSAPSGLPPEPQPQAPASDGVLTMKDGTSWRKRPDGQWQQVR